MGYKRPKNIMKKTLCLLLFFVGVCATSCKTIQSTAEYKDPTTFLRNVTVADLDVADERISFTFEPSRSVRRGGNQNVIKAAIHEALRANGGGDVLVDLEYITVTIPCLFSFSLSPIREITVSGYPAKYKNFRSLDDSIWAPTKLYPDDIREKTSIKDYIR
jgi:hypothetical protein